MPKTFFNFLDSIAARRPRLVQNNRNKWLSILFGYAVFNFAGIPAVNAADKKEPFFACESGYQFESKMQSARCIKKKRVSHRPPKSCPKNQGYKLAIDKKGPQDLCIASNNAKLNNQKLKPIAPTCSRGFRILSRRGKDSCVQEQKENIKPPSKKVRR